MPIDEDTSPASTGLRDLALTEHFVYATHARMGGSGWGTTIRFRRPPNLRRPDDGVLGVGDPDLLNWKLLRQTCDSVDEVDDQAYEFLCGSRDGSLVMFADPYRSDEVYAVKHEGEPETIDIKELADFFK